jgi:SOS-response transcriptional repressor LexA
MSDTLTPAQDRLWREIARHIDETGFVPSHREVMQALGFTGPLSVLERVRILAHKGYLTFESVKRRTIVLLRWPDGRERGPELPVGMPTERGVIRTIPCTIEETTP